MADIIEFGSQSGLNLYCVVAKGAQYWYDVTPTLENYNSGHWTSYDIAATEGAPGDYTATFPSAAPTGRYRILVYQRLAGTPAITDPLVLHITDYDWNTTSSAKVTFGSTLLANMTQISGSAVNATVAQLGVNVVNWSGIVVENGSLSNHPVIDVGWINGVLINADVGAQMPARIVSIADGAITGLAIAADAIGSSELAASAVTEIGTGVRTELATELARIDAAITSRMATFTLPTNFNSLAIDGSGRITVGTNADKTGYSLTQAFPSNFSSLAITAGGAVTAGTVSDKTGYSLTQTFPTNFSALVISIGGATTVGTNNDKTGYSLTQTFPSNFSSLAITGGGAVTAGTVSDKTGYSLLSTGLNLCVVDGKTLLQHTAYQSAMLCGESSGVDDVGPNTEIYVGLDGVTNRVSATMDAVGNRTSITLDP